MNFLKTIILSFFISTPLFCASLPPQSTKNAAGILSVKDIDSETGSLKERLKIANENKQAQERHTLTRLQNERLAQKSLALICVSGSLLTAVVIKNLLGF